jgi:RecA/RadA recombinase
MAVIKFDFGSYFGTDEQKAQNQRKKAEYLLEKLAGLLAPFSVSQEDFFTALLPQNVTGVYISSGNMSRELLTGYNLNVNIPNFFFRLHFDSYGNNILRGNTLILKGNLVIKARDQRLNCVRVKDLSLVDAAAEPWERDISCSIDYTTIYKPEFHAAQEENLVTLDLAKPENTPFLVSKKDFDDFTGPWRKYLEFTKAAAMRTIEFHPIAGKPRTKLVAEIVRSEEAAELFRDDTVMEMGRCLYVSADSPALSENESRYILVEAAVKRSEFDECGPKRFFRKQLGIAGVRQLEYLQKIKAGESVDRDPSCLDFERNLKFPFDEKNGVYVFSFLWTGWRDIRKIEDFEEALEQFGDKLYLVCAATGDLSLYRRGDETLKNLSSGDLQFPGLAGLFIDPSHFERSVNNFTMDSIHFGQEKLNPSQKEAVVKCLNSKSIFLIQGPPGTGKTQTITELVYQYNKMGKKVLLSSQSNIAIDNVIERLLSPELIDMNILPLRLVKKAGKTSERFLPDHLVDNVYDAAYQKFQGKIDAYNTFSENIQKLENKYEELEILYQTMSERLHKVRELEESINKANAELLRENNKAAELEEETRGCEKIKAVFDEYKRSGLPFENIQDDFVFPKLETRFASLGKSMNPPVKEDDLYNYGLAFKRMAGKQRLTHLGALLSGGEKAPELAGIEREIAKIKEAIDTTQKLGLPIEQLRAEINKKLQQKKEIDRKYPNTSVMYSFDASNEKFYFARRDAIADMKTLVQKEIEGALNFIAQYKGILADVFSEDANDDIQNAADNACAKLGAVRDSIRRKNIEIARLRKDLEQSAPSIKAERNKLDAYFTDFYTGKLNGASLPQSDEAKFKGIRVYIDSEKTRFATYKKDFEPLLPIYKSIAGYMKDREQFASAHRKKFTKTLLKHNANVYGLTCTSSTKFSKDKLAGKSGIEMDDVDIRDIGFDIVIIDEVSKATPIEVLIPCLYGKTVVLVGDQRQLPPVFKYNKNQFTDLSDEEQEQVLQGETTGYYRRLVEISLFERIFGQLKSNKAALKHQYRFNDAIMNCVNVFYDDSLILGGGVEQNNKKQHYLDIEIKGPGGPFPLICRKYSTYWFDSGQWADGFAAEAEIQEGETSLRNQLEVKITVKLLKMLDSAYGELKNRSPEDYRNAAGGAGKPGIAVVSMYGKHIDSLKQELRAEKLWPPRMNFKNIDLDISTVDDYQGKEKDIVILNMVDNKKPGAGRPSQFLEKFNRINVAISRSRTMLIIVGSSKYYQNVEVDVPSIDAPQTERKINAYYKIYRRCQSQWPAAQALGIYKKPGIKK